jgi:hypothetical protein
MAPEAQGVGPARRLGRAVTRVGTACAAGASRVTEAGHSHTIAAARRGCELQVASGERHGYQTKSATFQSIAFEGVVAVGGGFSFSRIAATGIDFGPACAAARGTQRFGRARGQRNGVRGCWLQLRWIGRESSTNGRAGWCAGGGEFCSCRRRGIECSRLGWCFGDGRWWHASCRCGRCGHDCGRRNFGCGRELCGQCGLRASGRVGSAEHERVGRRGRCSR